MINSTAISYKILIARENERTNSKQHRSTENMISSRILMLSINIQKCAIIIMMYVKSAKRVCNVHLTYLTTVLLV